jgi:hypothetical protein
VVTNFTFDDGVIEMDVGEEMFLDFLDFLLKDDVVK